MRLYTVSYEIQGWYGKRLWEKKRSQTKAESPADAIRKIKEKTEGYHTRNIEVVK